jgi:hypothetical protein
MHRGPLGKRMIVGQQSVSGRVMRRLQHEADRHAVLAVAGHGKSYGIALPLLRKSATTGRVSQVAQFPQLLIAWRGALLARGPAFASPSCAEGQPRGVKPATILEATFRHEKGAGQLSSERRLFYSETAGLATVEQSSGSGLPDPRHIRTVARSGSKLPPGTEPGSPRRSGKIVGQSHAGLLSWRRIFTMRADRWIAR